jgi:rubrerythrin
MKLYGFEKWMFQPFVTKRQEPPPIPEDIEKLKEIVNKSFEIIEKQQPAIFGTNSECAIKLRCPFCKSEFTGHESSGCFHHEILPMNCPVCGFPSNIIQALIEKRKK